MMIWPAYYKWSTQGFSIGATTALLKCPWNTQNNLSTNRMLHIVIWISKLKDIFSDDSSHTILPGSTDISPVQFSLLAMSQSGRCGSVDQFQGDSAVDRDNHTEGNEKLSNSKHYRVD